MKELFIEVHEELIDQYMDAHPGVSWGEAYDITAEHVMDCVTDRFADMVDYASERG